MKQSPVRISRTLPVAIIAALGLAACGGGAEPGSDPEGGGGGDVDGVANSWFLTGGSWGTTEASFNAWNKANPDEQIAFETFANDAYKEKIRTAVGSGEAPTLILSWTGGALADYASNDQVIDVTADTEDLRDRVLPSVAQNGEIDGKTYAVPMNDVQPVVLYFNKDLFEQAGVEVPTTWDEVMDVIPAFNDEGIAPFSLAGQSVWPELMWIQYLTDRNGGPEVFQAVLDGEPDAWSDPAITTSLEQIQELVDKDAFVSGFASVTADQGADVALVHTGRAAMLLQGSWVYASFKNDAPEFASSGSLGFTSFPAIESGAGDPTNIVGNPANFWSVSASADEKAQEAAKDYLNDFVYNEDSIDEMLKAGSIPPVDGLEDEFGGMDDEEFLTFGYDLVGEAPHFQLSWDQALPPAQSQELLTNLSQIFLGEITPQQFVDNMNATL